jgi:hypothetical protein
MSDVSLFAAGSAVPDSDGPLLFEVCPSDTARRRSPRVSIRHAGVLSWQEGRTETVEAVSTTSISRFGCALRSIAFLRPGIHVRFDFANKSIEGRVVYSLKDYSNNLVTIGVAFDEDAGEFWQQGVR